MKAKQPSKNPAFQKTGLFFLFIISGLILFVVFSHMRPLLPQPCDLVGRLILLAGTLSGALVLRRREGGDPYGQVMLGFFIALLAISIDYYLPSSQWLLNLLHIPLETPAGIALDKLDSSLIIIVTVILLTLLFRGSLGSLYLKKGHLKQGLTIGIIAFFICVVGAIPVSGMFFGAQNVTVSKALSWAPWILIFILGNAFNEELLFRGLFLQKYGAFLGRFLSNLVIAIPFALHHSGVSYTPDALMFLAFLLPLALTWGWITQKTEGLWGAILFHAWTDIPIVLSIFSAFH